MNGSLGWVYVMVPYIYLDLRKNLTYEFFLTYILKIGSLQLIGSCEFVSAILIPYLKFVEFIFAVHVINLKLGETMFHIS